MEVALQEPPCASRLDLAQVQRTAPPPAVQQSTREALWSHANIERDERGLAQLEDDPHPLARLIGACALMRRESRGAHQRTDHTATDHKLDRRHIVVDPDMTLHWETWE
jgi:L-aspartate oxidase